MSLFLAIADEEFGINHIGYNDITDYEILGSGLIDHQIMLEIVVRIVEGRYSRPLSPIEHAPDVLRKLNQICRPTLFVTARPEADHIAQWMCDVMETDHNGIEVIATGSFEDKCGVLKDRGISCFVEDRLETCFLLADAGIEPVVFVQPWNRKPHPFAEVGSWQELEAMIGMK
jgi:hypothetical protein